MGLRFAGRSDSSAIVDGDDAAFANYLVEDFNDMLNVVSSGDPGTAVAFAVHVDTVVMLDRHANLCSSYFQGVTIPIARGSGG